MNIRNGFALLLLLCLVVSFSVAQQSIKIYATDGVGLDSVLIGIHPSATGGIDAGLGEFELPPFTPTFDFRCVTMSGFDNLGMGARINYHEQVTETQTDKYRLAFQSDEFGDPVTFSWQAGLASVGGGYWRMYEMDGTTLLCDMTTQTSYTYHTFDNLPQYLIVVKGDGKGFLTATYLDLADAVDYKGKAKAEKGKPYNSEAKFVLTAPDSVVGLHVEFSQGIYEHFGLDFFNMPSPDPAGKIKKFDYTLPPSTPKLYAGTEVEVWVHGAKGKAIEMKKYWWVNAFQPEKWKPTKLGPGNRTFSGLWFRMPNWNNVGEDIYGGPKAASPPGGPDGIWVGNPSQVGVNAKGKPIFRYIFHKKWKDLQKTLNKKGTKHSTVPSECLLTLGGKEVLKPYKSFPPDKYNNLLVAELATLKFNAYSSDNGNTGTGFRNLHYVKQGGDPAALPDDVILDSIMWYGDKYLTCEDDRFTGAELTTLIHNINGLFAGEFDTSAYGGDPFKYGGGGTILKPAKYLAEVPELYRTSLSEVAPVIKPAYAIDNEPMKFELGQNYPNPFNPVTTIEFELPEDAFVTLKVYNVLGQEVATILDHEEFYEGYSDIEFDASALSSGVYYYRLIVNDGQFTEVKKMMLLK